jgi:HK97 family phage prohead protease/HK97 family phage major capsid protein
MPYSEYPEAMRNNARRGQRLNEEVGGRCATDVGKETARILAAGETLSDARVKRMYSFLSRAETYYNPDDTEACGTISYLLWGGKTAHAWSREKVEQMNNDERTQHDDAEKRTMGTIEVRESDGDEMTLEGYAAVYNSETDLGHFREVIKPGAFDDVLDNDVRALINHDPNLILGRTTNGTLELSVDERGLKYRVKLGDQQYAKDFYESVKRGDISQSSFAFTIDQQSWNEERTVRSVDKVRQLLDVSPVTYPAYAAATVQARDQQLELDDAIAEAVAEPDTTVTETQTNSQPMNLNEMKATRAKHADRFEELVNVAETENRDWTNNEQEEADLCKREVERLDGKIARRQAHEDMIARQAQMGGASVSEAKEINKINRSFSLSRAVQAASFGKALEGAEAEWSQEAAKEYQMRGLQMSGQIGIPASALYRAGAADDFQAGSGDGSGFVATTVPGVIDALRTPTMAERIGVTTINNATGNLKFPRVSAKAAGTEETEVSADAASGLELDELTLSPIRVAANTKYSKQLILQGGAQVDAMISRELAAGINETIDKAVFAKAAAGAGTIVDKAGGAVASADLYNMQKAVLAAGGDLARCQYVGSPSALSILKAEAAIASVSALMEGNNIDGYATNFTPNLVDDDASQGAVLFGDFTLGMVMAFFGGIDLLVDPYSNAGTAQIALHVNKFYDVDVRQAGALAYTSDFIA